MHGDPITEATIDDYLDNLFTGDMLMRAYAPGGAATSRPSESKASPSLNWWLRYAHPDVLTQTPEANRALSNPEFIVALVDVQQPDQTDYKFGSAGLKMRPALPYLSLGQARIYALLHNKLRTVDGVDFHTICVCAERGTDNTTPGNYQVFVGWRVQFRIT